MPKSNNHIIKSANDVLAITNMFIRKNNIFVTKGMAIANPELYKYSTAYEVYCWIYVKPENRSDEVADVDYEMSKNVLQYISNLKLRKSKSDYINNIIKLADTQFEASLFNVSVLASIYKSYFADTMPQEIINVPTPSFVGEIGDVFIDFVKVETIITLSDIDKCYIFKTKTSHELIFITTTSLPVQKNDLIKISGVISKHKEHFSKRRHVTVKQTVLSKVSIIL